jgi:dihydrofolate synthase/folylpolyglutamate synthase
MIESSYAQLMTRLLSVNKHGGIKLGLDNVQRLNTLLGNPAHAFPSIHVAGTNGKGSVVTKIAAALQAAGLRVGLYTSPHIACFRERIRVDGSMISEAEVEKHLTTLFALTEEHQIPATFFELTTMMAFSHFVDEDIDIAVIETGLGGRFDATNIVRTKLSVITSISLEHTEILGNTIEEIACEKAGIIKPNVPVVIGPRVPLNTIKKIAKELNSPCIQVKGSFSDFHAENDAVAKMALETIEAPPHVIARGLRATPPCRMQIFSDIQLALKFKHIRLPDAIVLDVAHNPDGIKWLLQSLKRRFPNRRLRFVIGLSKNKDIHGCFDLLKNTVTHYHLVESQNDRAASIDYLKTSLLSVGVSQEDISCEESISAGILHALIEAGEKKEVVIVCGTFFIMAEARKALGIIEPQDHADMNERSYSQTFTR